MKKFLGIITLVVLVAVMVTGCTDETSPDSNGENVAGLIDGSWQGNSTMDPENTRYAFGSVTLEVQNGVIVSVDYEEIQGPFADAKGEDYHYEVFHQAVDALTAQLLETQDASELDTVAGATSTTGYFTEAVVNALESANAGQQLYNNGTYVAKTDFDARGAYFGIGYVTFENGSVAHVLYEERDTEGVPKSEDYSYELYHDAVQLLSNQLVESGSLADVDAVAGATSTTNNFKEVMTPYFALAGN